MGRLFRWLFALAVLLVIAAALAFAVFLATSGQSPGEAIRGLIARISIAGRYDEINTPISLDDNTSHRFNLELGDTPAFIADYLVTYGFITDSDLFVDYARAEGLDRQFEAGIYFIRRTQSLAEIAHQLTDSTNSYIPFRVLAGWRIEQIAEAVDSNPMFAFTGADFMAAAYNIPDRISTRAEIPAGANLEGFLFPGDYQLAPDTTPERLVDTLTDSFVLGVGPQLLDEILNRNLSLRDVVSLASIVQREAVQVDEMPLIAGVYLNRLKIGMKLDADPTVQYALGLSRGSWWPQISIADYSSVNSDFNTYLVFGLPPGPIANPGTEAVRAVVFPAESEFLYFRADCRDDGYHDFARTYEEHIANGC